MNLAAVELNDRIGELLDVLRREIEQMEYNLSILTKLRMLVVKHDNPALEAMLEAIRYQAGKYEKQNSDRNLARQRLAEFFNCGTENITLSKLQKIAPSEQQSLIASVKEQLSDLVNRLTVEYKSTAALMSELARFNRVLLDSIFQRSQLQNLTYNASGIPRRNSEAAFMSFEL